MFWFGVVIGIEIFGPLVISNHSHFLFQERSDVKIDWILLKYEQWQTSKWQLSGISRYSISHKCWQHSKQYHAVFSFLLNNYHAFKSLFLQVTTAISCRLFDIQHQLFVSFFYRTTSCRIFKQKSVIDSHQSIIRRKV